MCEIYLNAWHSRDGLPRPNYRDRLQELARWTAPRVGSHVKLQRQVPGMHLLET